MPRHSYFNWEVFIQSSKASRSILEASRCTFVRNHLASFIASKHNHNHAHNQKRIWRWCGGIRMMTIYWNNSESLRDGISYHNVIRCAISFKFCTSCSLQKIAAAAAAAALDWAVCDTARLDVDWSSCNNTIKLGNTNILSWKKKWIVTRRGKIFRLLPFHLLN